MNKQLALILRILEDKKPVETLFEHGIEFSQYFLLINAAIEKDFVVYCSGSGEDNFVLTEAGREFLSKSQIETKSKISWISKLEEEKIDKLDINSVYVPNMSTIKKLI